MEARHIGIIITIIGTVALAFSVKTKHQYSGDKYMERIVELSEKGGYFHPTKTWIDKRLFWFGLGCVALGSALQW